MRYAIYYTPPADDPLLRRAAQWLGRDAFSGMMLEQPSIAAFPGERLVALTGDARRYGFHATLKAPFELAEGRTESELIEALEAFAATTPAFTVPKLVLGQLGRFFALVPAAPDADLQAFAGDCVRRFDAFRAPLSNADFLRREPERLSLEERRHLIDWGYPYVFDQFRFHMTLTGRIDPADQPAMRHALDTFFAEIVPAPREIAHLALFAEPERGAPFVVRRLAELSVTPQQDGST